MVASEDSSDSGERTIGQLFDDIDRNMSCRRDITRSLSALEVLKGNSVFLRDHRENLVYRHRDGLRSYDLVGDASDCEVDRDFGTGENTLR